MKFVLKTVPTTPFIGNPPVCGIVGFAGFTEPQLLSQMSLAVAHRGPDASGSWESDRTGLAPAISLAVRRLAIMDPAGGHQPMQGDSAVVAFNGEIYNDGELRDELKSLGSRFHTTSDTEVILRGYEKWGFEQLIGRLNGMFAVAIHDKRSGELLIARDRTGQKPLYYVERNGRLAFGSEIKALLETGLLERRLNHAAIDQYLALRYVPQPATLFADVHVLPGGHWLKWQDGQLKVDAFWQPIIIAETTQHDVELLEELTHLFDRAIERTLRSDVAVGAYLSGGVDSSLIVATMTAAAEKGLPFSGQTYSVGFGAASDETELAAVLAGKLGIQNRCVELSAAALEDLPRVLWHLERPIGEPLILAYDALAQSAAADVKAVFSGEGADELFAGYSFHRVLSHVERMVDRVPGSQNGLAMLLKMIPVSMLNRLFPFPAYLGEAGKQRVVSFAQQFGQRHTGENYAALRTLFDVAERRNLYAADFRHHASEEWIHGNVGAADRPLECLLNLQYHDWLQDFALLRQDKLSMAHGVEVRLPFLDNTLIEFCGKLPRRCKLRGLQNKVLLRRLAAARLPRDYAHRKKQAFYFPLESMYQHKSFQNLIAQTLNRETIVARNIFDPQAIRSLLQRADSGEFLVLKQVMSLVILELWMQMFIDDRKLW